MARFDFKSNKHNNNSEVNKLQLQKQGQEMYDDTFAKNTGVEGIPIHNKPLLTAIAGSISAAVTFYSFYCLQPGEEGAAHYLFAVKQILDAVYESNTPLPLDERAYKFDTSAGWTYGNALREACQLVFDDPSFLEAWLCQDTVFCYIRAEKILCVQLPPNALLAIKKHLGRF